MFYLQKKEIDDVRVGDRVMVLSDFSGIPAGTKGTITEIYGRHGSDLHGASVKWDPKRCGHFMQSQQEYCDCPGSRHDDLVDGFNKTELEYLGFETAKHPTKA